MDRARTGVSETLDVAVVVPFHSNDQFARSLLLRNLNSIARQIVKPRELVISLESRVHPSTTALIAETLRDRGVRATIVRNNGKPGIAGNLTSGILASDSSYIHPLFYDDYLTDVHFYRHLRVELRSSAASWLMTRSFIQVLGDKGRQSILEPRFGTWIEFGINTAGPPSAMIVQRNAWPERVIGLSHLYDIELLTLLSRKHGWPKILNDSWVGVTSWKGQTQHRSDRATLRKEYNLYFRRYRDLSLDRATRAARVLVKRGNHVQAQSLLLGWLNAWSPGGAPRTSRDEVLCQAGIDDSKAPPNACASNTGEWVSTLRLTGRDET